MPRAGSQKRRGWPLLLPVSARSGAAEPGIDFVVKCQNGSALVFLPDGSPFVNESGGQAVSLYQTLTVNSDRCHNVQHALTSANSGIEGVLAPLLPHAIHLWRGLNWGFAFSSQKTGGRVLTIFSRSTAHSLDSITDRFSPGALNLNSRKFKIALVCVIAIVSYVVPKVEAALILNPQTAWPLWPGCAILVAALMLVPRRMWAVLIPASFAGFVLYDLQAGVPMSSIAWFIPADTIQVLITALGLRYCFERVPRLNNIGALGKYCFFAVLLGPCTAALVSAPGIPGNYWTSWRTSFLSEMLAFITVTPAILSWFSDGPAWLERRGSHHLEFLVLLVSTVLLSYLTFGTSSIVEFPVLLYALVPFLLWSALRFGSVGITSSMMIIGFLSVWGVMHGQGPFQALGISSSILSLQLFLIVAAAPLLVLTALVEDQKIVANRLASLSRGFLQAQEEERSRIGRELHDDINQRLAMVAIELEQLLENPSKIPVSVNGIHAEVMEIASDVQALSHELHSSKLVYLGCVAAMKSWCREFAQLQAVEVDFTSDVQSVLPVELGLPLYRVLQEALHNVIKHSGVKHIEVQVREQSGEIHLIITDSGRGFDVEAAMQGKGLGLTSMRERIQLVNGTITIESTPTAGTRIYARLPIQSDYISTQKTA